MTALCYSSALPDMLRARLDSVLGPRGLLSEAEAMAPYQREWRGRYRGEAALVALPADTAQVAETVRLCHAAGVAMVPQGGNTGLCGGAVAGSGSLLLSLARLERIRAVDPLDGTMTVEAGVILADAQAAAAAHNRLFPLSLASEGSCRIGGVLSTNAGGTAVLRYGTARDLVLGLEVVLPDGRVWNGLSRLRKDNTGYDLKQLFLGAEGTLGVITAAVLKLFPRPRTTVTVLVAVPGADAATRLLADLREEVGDLVTGFEFMNGLSLDMVFRHLPGAVNPFRRDWPATVLVEVSSTRADPGLADAVTEVLGRGMAAGTVLDAALAASGRQAQDLWRLREAIPDVQRFDGASIKHDVAVPVSLMPRFIAEASAAVSAAMPGVRIVAFGHIGDGNVHFNLTQPADLDAASFQARRPALNRIVHDAARRLDGSFSAEHGIGLLKRPEMDRLKPALDIELMRGIKDLLDPAGLMNPGKVLP